VFVCTVADIHFQKVERSQVLLNVWPACPSTHPPPIVWQALIFAYVTRFSEWARAVSQLLQLTLLYRFFFLFSLVLFLLSRLAHPPIDLHFGIAILHSTGDQPVNKKKEGHERERERAGLQFNNRV
jgi:hypothetical protein